MLPDKQRFRGIGDPDAVEEDADAAGGGMRFVRAF